MTLKADNRTCQWLVAGLFLAALALTSVAQQVVDKTVAVVSDSTRSELITYSDIMWEMALQPNVPLDPPRSEDLNRVLQTLIDQRLFALEAERLPRAAPDDKEIAAAIAHLLTFFPSISAFETRLKQVGFTSVKDEGFERLIARRLATEKYIDFRFRAFAVVSADEESRYYREVFTPDFRKRFPGLLMPTLDEKRAEIKDILIETKIADRIENFLDDAKRRATVEVLIEV